MIKFLDLKGSLCPLISALSTFLYKPRNPASLFPPKWPSPCLILTPFSTTAREIAIHTSPENNLKIPQPSEAYSLWNRLFFQSCHTMFNTTLPHLTQIRIRRFKTNLTQFRLDHNRHRGAAYKYRRTAVNSLHPTIDY